MTDFANSRDALPPGGMLKAPQEKTHSEAELAKIAEARAAGYSGNSPGGARRFLSNLGKPKAATESKSKPKDKPKGKDDKQGVWARVTDPAYTPSIPGAKLEDIGRKLGGGVAVATEKMLSARGFEVTDLTTFKKAFIGTGRSLAILADAMNLLGLLSSPLGAAVFGLMTTASAVSSLIQRKPESPDLQPETQPESEPDPEFEA